MKKGRRPAHRAINRDPDAQTGVPSPLIGQQDVYDQANRALALKSAVPGRLERDISLTIQARDLEKPEFARLGRSMIAVGGKVVGAIAAQNGFFQLHAPVGTLCVVESIVLANPSAATQSWNIGFVATQIIAPSFRAQSARDDRWGLAAGASTSFDYGTTAAPPVPTGLEYHVALAGTEVTTRTPWILSGGAFLVVVAQGANFAVGCTITWRERAILDTEQ